MMKPVFSYFPQKMVPNVKCKRLHFLLTKGLGLPLLILQSRFVK